MKYSVFYRSYRGDFQWLKYSLATLKKYLKGYSEIVIVVPHNDFDLLSKQTETWDCPDGIVLFRESLVVQDDYLGQQLCKLKAHEYVSNPYVLFVDSDMMFIRETTIEQFVRDGKPCILKTAYTELSATPEQGTDKLGAACVWKPITEKAIGFPVEYEYMRRIPLLYHKSTLKNLWWYFVEQHGISLSEYIQKVQDRAFSEFNLLGAYADRFESKKYYFLDTAKEPLPELNSKQYWSWGSLTPEIETEIKSFLQ